MSSTHLSHFYRESPGEIGANDCESWITRGKNFVVIATKGKKGTVLDRSSEMQNDEYMVLTPEHVGCKVSTSDGNESSLGNSLFIVPPGNSTVELLSDGWVFRVFSKFADDVMQKAVNANDYAVDDGSVAPIVSWPMPVDGYKLRHYPLEKYVREDTTMRLFRTRNLMINIFLPATAPRSVTKLTPHSHDDFEQGSLALAGGYVHHMRYPWTNDKTTWKADEHLETSAPSLLIIPPKVIHTSQSLGTSGMRLVDIFSPPRIDFSLKPGLVCNENEYPILNN